MHLPFRVMFRLWYRDRRIRNWLDNHRGWVQVYRPRTRDELCRTVHEGAKRYGKVRAAGSGIALSRIVPPCGLRGDGGPRSDQGALIDTRHLRRILRFGQHDGRPTVTVEAGIPIGTLSYILSGYGLALVSPTIIPHVTVGGAISTGSHGTGRSTATFSDGVVEMVVVNAKGELRRFHLEDDDEAKQLYAARCGLGCFGIIYCVTLVLTRDFIVRIRREERKFDDVMNELTACGSTPTALARSHAPRIPSEGQIASQEFVELYWFPGSENVIVYTFERDEHAALSRLPWLPIMLVSELFNLLLAATIVPLIHRHFRYFIPLYFKLEQNFALPKGEQVMRASLAFHYLPTYMQCYDVEWALPLDDAGDAHRKLKQLLDEYAQRGEYPVDHLTHTRFVGPSVSYMASTYGRPTCCIEIVSSKQGSPIPERRDGHRVSETFFDVFDRWMCERGARPHWGKNFVHPPKQNEQEPRWQEFERVRKQFDPEGVFVSDYLQDQVFP